MTCSFCLIWFSCIFFLLFCLDSLQQAKQYIKSRPRRFRFGHKKTFNEPTIVSSIELSSSSDDEENVSIGEHQLNDDTVNNVQDVNASGAGGSEQNDDNIRPGQVAEQANVSIDEHQLNDDTENEEQDVNASGAGGLDGNNGEVRMHIGQRSDIADDIGHMSIGRHQLTDENNEQATSGNGMEEAAAVPEVN